MAADPALDCAAAQSQEYAALLRDYGGQYQIAWVPAIGIWIAAQQPVGEHQVLADTSMAGLRGQLEGHRDPDAARLQALQGL